MLYKPITVSVDALTRVLRLHDLGDPHLTLAVGAIWVDQANDTIADDIALRTFVDTDMGDRCGLSTDMIDSLTVLARPEVEYYGWFTQGATMTAVLAASIGSDAVLAVRRGHQVRLMPADEARLAEALVGCLPSTPPSCGPSINIRQSRAVGGHTGQRRDREAGLAPLRRSRKTGAGELHVALRQRITQRRTIAPYPVGYHDTVDGRWWIQVIPGHDENWIVAVPGTDNLLITRLHEALDGLHR